MLQNIFLEPLRLMLDVKYDGEHTLKSVEPIADCQVGRYVYEHYMENGKVLPAKRCEKMQEELNELAIESNMLVKDIYRWQTSWLKEHGEPTFGRNTNRDVNSILSWMLQEMPEYDRQELKADVERYVRELADLKAIIDGEIQRLAVAWRVPFGTASGLLNVILMDKFKGREIDPNYLREEARAIDDLPF